MGLYSISNAEHCKKFTIYFTRTETFCIDIEAESEDEAVDMYWEDQYEQSDVKDLSDIHYQIEQINLDNECIYVENEYATPAHKAIQAVQRAKSNII